MRITHVSGEGPERVGERRQEEKDKRKNLAKISECEE